MTMNEQMIRDYSLYLKPDHIEGSRRDFKSGFERYGDIVAIDDVYDGKDLIERRYKTSVESPYGMLLDGIRASEDNTLNRLLGLETAPLILKETKPRGELTVKTYVAG
jgi:hypothetical protein